MSEFNLQKQIDCVAREIKMREYVYPTRVTARKMSVDKSVHELGAMRAVLATLIGLQAAQSLPAAERPADVSLLNDVDRGVYRKYDVRRLNDAAGKHADCEYYVLDLQHDKFAAPALEAYARACFREFPSLASDLGDKAAKIRERK